MTDQPAITVDGHAIPLLGFGTWNLTPELARTMVAEALRIGYRHIDTAWIYRNEAAVGDGIRDAIAAGHVARDDIWLTTKIWVAHFDREGLLAQARESAASLGFTPDLLLLHWPKKEPTFAETLGALNEARAQGLAQGWSMMCVCGRPHSARNACTLPSQTFFPQHAPQAPGHGGAADAAAGRGAAAPAAAPARGRDAARRAGGRSRCGR